MSVFIFTSIIDSKMEIVNANLSKENQQLSLFVYETNREQMASVNKSGI
jgi:hypothetical protein